MAQDIVATPDRRDFERVIRRVAAIAEARAYRARQDASRVSCCPASMLAADTALGTAGLLGNLCIVDDRPVAFALSLPAGRLGERVTSRPQHIRERREVPS